MRSRFLRFIVRLLRQEYGAITVMFAIMFPLLMMFYSVALRHLGLVARAL